MNRVLTALLLASSLVAVAQTPAPRMTRAEKKAAKKAAQAAPAPAAKPAPVATAIVANKESKTFHRAGCAYVAKMKEANRVGFANAAEAAKAGYKPCKECKPQ